MSARRIKRPPPVFTGVLSADRSWAARLAHSFWPVATALLVARIVLDSRCDLVPDEAYYWVWSRHLATGYFDHPPMVAWLIWISTHLVGNTELGVRLPAAILSVGTLAILYRFACRLLPDARAVGYLLFMWIAGPLLPVMGTIHTPDVSALFFSMGALFWVAVALDRDTVGIKATGKSALSPDTGKDKAPDARVPAARAVSSKPSFAVPWLLFGLFTGLALLSKYTAVLLPISVMLHLLTSSSGRRHWRQPWIYLAALVALAIFSPVIAWNYSHHWVSFLFQIHHGAGDGLTETLHAPLPIFLARLKGLGEFIGGQALVFTPVLFVVACVVAAANALGGVRPRQPSLIQNAPPPQPPPAVSENSARQPRKVHFSLGTRAAASVRRPINYLERIGGLQQLRDVDRMFLWCGIVPLLFFGWASTRSHGEINWPAFAYFPLSLLIARYLSENWHGHRVQWVRLGCQVALGFSLVVHLVAAPWIQQNLRRYVPLPHQVSDLWGWREFGRQLSARIGQTPVVCNRHQDAGEAAFYMRSQPEVWCEGVGTRPTAYEYFDRGRPDYMNTPRIVFLGDHVKLFKQEFGYKKELAVFNIAMPSIDPKRIRGAVLLEK